MTNFIASLIVASLLTMYIIFAKYIISLALSVSLFYGIIVFVIVLAVAIDFLTKVALGNGKSRK